METTTINEKEVLANEISDWLKEHAENAQRAGYVIGISGGVDSALVSTLCARTGLKTLCLEMPIRQGKSQVSRAKEHIEWLKDKYNNVVSAEVDLSDLYDRTVDVYDGFRDGLEAGSGLNPVDHDKFNFVLGNTRSRMRMIALYQFAGMYDLLVAGTGNKVEDFGIGFYSKYGDGGVDISPIADLMKTEVWDLAKYLGVNKNIIDAVPTDGLHEDGRSDLDQIGASYPELEWAMEWLENNDVGDKSRLYDPNEADGLNERQKEVLVIYLRMHKANQHKMNPIPVFKRNGR